MLKKNELVEQFNKEEQKKQSLKEKKLKRRVRFPKLSERIHKALDRADELVEKRAPVDCVSGKWIKEAAHFTRQ